LYLSQLTETTSSSSSASRHSTKPWRISILITGDEVNALISWLCDVGYMVTASSILTADSAWRGSHALYVTYLQNTSIYRHMLIHSKGFWEEYMKVLSSLVIHLGTLRIWTSDGATMWTTP
jgi:hypothetical protein